MRICMVYQAEFPPAERIEKTAQVLAAAGHRVFLLCNDYGKHPVRAQMVGDVHVIRVPPMTRRRGFAKLVKFPIALNPLWIVELLRVVRRQRIEALHVIDLPLAAAVLGIGRVLGLPVLYDMWENYPEALRGWSRTDWKTRLFKNPAVAARVERWVIRRVDHVFTVVEESRDRLLSLGVHPGKVSVVTNGIDLDMFTSDGLTTTPLDAEPETYKLLFVGALTTERGLDDIIRALPLVRPRIPAVRLYIGGSGNDEPRLRQLAAQCGVADLVRFTGWVPFQQIRSYIERSDLCLVPHIYNDFINTTVPNKLFQYMAAAKPVLVSHARPLARIVREARCGFVFESGNPEDAAARILDAYASRADLEIGARGRCSAEARYTWDKASEPLVSVYRHLA